MEIDLSKAKWFKSTHSGPSTSCVEVASVDDCVALRDTKDRSKPAHVFTRAEWAAFIAGVRDGEFDFT